MLEHDREVAPGLPEELPQHERLLWQGVPGFDSLLRGSFHVAKLVTYFAAMLVVQLVLASRGGAGVGEAVASTAGFALLAAAALVLLAFYVRLVARSTLFTITDRRIVLRTGVAVPVTINLPFSRIESADLRLHRDGSGDLSILPEAGSRVSWLLLWPMVKPFRLWRVRPVLRGVADATAVARILGDALSTSAATSNVEPEVSGGEPAKAKRQKPAWRPYPGIPLAAMVSLAVIALVGAAVTVLNDTGEPDSGIELTSSIELRFEDRPDGSVSISEAASGRLIDDLEPGTNGFIRATLRTLAGARRDIGRGAAEPFTVGRTADGRVFLIDPVSGRQIDLRAFGPTNADAFARYLDADLPVVQGRGERNDSDDATGTTIALQQKESTP